MTKTEKRRNPSPLGFLGRLAADTSGNTLVLVAASIAPILSIIGGGIDVGRGYLSETRLQQACDAGVLAARKKLGSAAIVDGVIPTDVGSTGQRFFNINFTDGAYGTTDRQFQMKLETDFSISGKASVTVPTTIMAIFGYTEMPVTAECQARLNFANTDVMMVLDTTGSMNETTPGDSMSRIAALRATILNFYNQLAAATKPGTRIRYGFVPYSTNVNVGGLLKDEWVTDTWTYQSRKLNTGGLGGPGGLAGYYSASSPVSGSQKTTTESTYPAVLSGGVYSCPTKPANTATSSTVLTGTTTEVFAGPPAGIKTIKTYVNTRNGDTYAATLNGTTCTVTKTTYANYVLTWQYITEPTLGGTGAWHYAALPRSTANWRTQTQGCIEERDTYEITDYDNVDLSKALDLDIDRVPTPGDSSTQWRPQYPESIYARQLMYNGTGALTTDTIDTSDGYVQPWAMGLAACPAAASKLQVFSLGQITSLVASLTASGSTYHDIGMIWGGRLLSPTGIFADENADVSASDPTSRNLIFFTDGQTSPLDLSYTSYGLEPLDGRRWRPGSPMSLKDTVEKRFAFACKEVRKRNINVWLVAFGTEVNPVMAECAGPGHYFSAANAAELNGVFSKIAQNIGDLRIVR